MKKMMIPLSYTNKLLKNLPLPNQRNQLTSLPKLLNKTRTTTQLPNLRRFSESHWQYHRFSLQNLLHHWRHNLTPRMRNHLSLTKFLSHLHHINHHQTYQTPMPEPDVRALQQTLPSTQLSATLRKSKHSLTTTLDLTTRRNHKCLTNHPLET